MSQTGLKSKQSSYLGDRSMSLLAAWDMDRTRGVLDSMSADPEIMSRKTHTEERKLSNLEYLAPATTTADSQSATVAATLGG